MMKDKIKTICKYLIVLIVLGYAIYEVIHYALKLSDNNAIAYKVGIGVYSIIIIASIICLILLIKNSIYRSKFTHNDFE